MRRTNVSRLRPIVNGTIDKGCDTPIRYNSLISNPLNIKNVMLNPTEKRITSTRLVWFNLIILRRMYPGINER